MINRSSLEKIYNQIANSIEIDIQDRFEVGDLYLSEKILTEKFAVNRHTVRRAIEELVKQGILEKRHGFGTFVAEKRLSYRIKNQAYLSDSLSTRGLSVETTLISQQKITAKGGVAEALQLKSGDKVMHIETLRKIEGKAICLTSQFFPMDVFNRDLSVYKSGYLETFVKSEPNSEARQVSKLVTSIMPNASDGFHLELVTGLPILKVKTINVDVATGRRVEYLVARLRSDMIQLEILMDV